MAFHRNLVAVACVAAALLPSCGRAAGGGDISNPPEDPMPAAAPSMRIIPAGPEYAAPSPQELLKDCKSKDFVECMREWRPPPPPPPPPEPPKMTAEEEKAKEEAKAKAEEEAKRRAAAAPPPPPKPGAAGEPPPGGPPPGKAPPPNPAADKASLDALAKAINDAGLAGKIQLPDAPTDGSVELKLDNKPPGKPAAGKK